jgi:glycosyltransferase involved in cell wall biosynthesis
MGEKIDLIVISTACHTAVNRKIYKEILRNGISVRLVVPEGMMFPSGYIKSAPQQLDDPPITFLKITSANTRTARFVGLSKVLRKYHPKMVLLDLDPISVSALLIGIWCRMNNVELLAISCENMPFDLKYAFNNKGWRGIPAAIIKRILIHINKALVHEVFTINNEGTDIFRSEGFRNVRKIPLGFDPVIFKVDNNARAKIRKNLSLDGLVIGFFGRVTYEKGIHILLASLKRLKHLKWTLIMDEFKDYKNEFHATLSKQIEDSGLSNRIVHVNPKHDEMGEYINAADIVVMPSISTPKWIEQYGRVAPESMACGKLVVASNSGALPMLLDGHGVLVSEGNVDELSNVLEKFVVHGRESLTRFSESEISNYAHNSLSIQAQLEIMLKSMK